MLSGIANGTTNCIGRPIEDRPLSDRTLIWPSDTEGEACVSSFELETKEIVFPGIGRLIRFAPNCRHSDGVRLIPKADIRNIGLIVDKSY